MDRVLSQGAFSGWVVQYTFQWVDFFAAVWSLTNGDLSTKEDWC
jgi:hypothetical protein